VFNILLPRLNVFEIDKSRQFSRACLFKRKGFYFFFSDTSFRRNRVEQTDGWLGIIYIQERCSDLTEDTLAFQSLMFSAEEPG
jgi:hypothetical protein